MKTLACSCGKEILVNDEDYEYCLKHLWHCSDSGVVFRVDYDVKIPMSQDFLGPLRVGFLYDHENRNYHDNQRSNLRIATRSQNQGNKGIQKNNKSGYKGVRMKKGVTKPWYASIWFNNKSKHIGIFETAEEAARAYDKEAKKQWGEFAFLNFPEQISQPIQNQ